MLLSAAEVSYQVVLDPIAFLGPSSLWTKEEDLFVLPTWEVASSHSYDFLNDFFPLYEVILEVMNGPEWPWEEFHHHSYFLSGFERVKHDDFRATLNENIGYPMVPLGTHGVCAKGNMANLSLMIPINISWIPGKIKNVYIGADCSPNEIKIYTDIFK